MLLKIAHQHLGWPTHEEVLRPSGAGPAVYARLVQSKLGNALARRNDVHGLDVGILAGDSMADATEPPLAIVCEFKKVASDAAIEEAHRLAWNFSRAPLLITLEPHIIRSWTTCERPRVRPNGSLPEAEIEPLRIDPRQPINFSQAAARSLSWVSFASGQVFQEYRPRFPRDKCADETLLDNLKAVRAELVSQELSIETVHDLLARLMFVQFLFHRKDDQGRAALTSEWLKKQYESKRLSAPYEELESILRNHKDAYSLFQLLNERFNGDLFPGKATDPHEREEEWRAEMKEVESKHLALLADFVGGKVLPNGQRSLWPMYSFDVIPLEFISSIYEAFVSKEKGTHYTPAYLVDMVLDTCLPWDDDEWDVKVLDPACGSGIFLVKAFQRLISRWHYAHKFCTKLDTDLLRKLLTENLFGVDVQPEAVRVACFSLYLAMCDELEPRYIWDRVKFPPLRGSRLIAADFFKEDVPGFRTFLDRERYDIVVGNAPWGTGTANKGPYARKWAKTHRWDISYKDIGPLFLAKGARLAKPTGCVSMLQSSGLLFKSSGKAESFRKQLLKKYKIEQIVNLTALRFGLFADAVGPACIFTLCPIRPDGSPITYVSPKPSRTPDDEFRIVFDAYDYHAVYVEEALEDPSIWTALMWGGRRDYSLVRRLATYPSIEKLEKKRLVKTRTGIIRGSNPTMRQNSIVGRPILDTPDFPASGFPYLDASRLPVNDNPFIHWKDSTNWDAFDPPQLLLKLAWRRTSNRFHARIVRPSSSKGALCSTSFVSVHFMLAAKELMSGACLTYNSRLAIYYLLHTSSRFASFRQEVNADELLRVPLPDQPVDLNSIKKLADTDNILRDAFKLKPAEWTLIDDVFEYTMEAFGSAKQPRTKKHGEASDGPRIVDDGMLTQYGNAFTRVLRSGFGLEKRICVTVYRIPPLSRIPVQLVAVHLDWPGSEQGIQFCDVQTEELLRRIVELAHAVEQRSRTGTTVRRRVFQAYDSVNYNRSKVPTVFLCKPNLSQYWTRSMAMRDADVVSADLVRLAAAKRLPRRIAGA